MRNLRARPLALAITAAFAAANGQGIAVADDGALFESRILAGTVLADAHGGEGKCGEGKCGDDESAGSPAVARTPPTVARTPPPPPPPPCGRDAGDGFDREPGTGKTALHRAVEDGNPEAVKVLVQRFGKDLASATDNACKVPKDHLGKNAKEIAEILNDA